MSKDGGTKDDEIKNLRGQVSAIAKALALELPYQASLVKRIEQLIETRDASQEESRRLRVENAKLVEENESLGASLALVMKNRGIA